MARPKYLLLLLAVAGIALSACGGNDHSSSSKSVAGGASGGHGATGVQGGTSGTTGAQRAKQKKTGGSRGGSKLGARKRRAGSGTGGSRPRSSSTAPATPATPSPPSSTSPTPTLTPKQLREARKGLYKQARFICKASTLEGLAQQYHISVDDPAAIAKAFAAPYPSNLRSAAAAGCKRGLLDSK
jgi:hypothetical protein